VASLGGGALVSLIAGIGFSFGVSGNRSDAQSLSDANRGINCAANPAPAVCAQASDLKNAYDRDSTLSTVFFVGAGVFGAGAIAAALFWPNRSESPQKGIRVIPTFNAQGASLQGIGRF
jgi:hypothetical protein